MPEIDPRLSQQLAREARRDAEGVIADLRRFAREPDIVVTIPRSLEPPPDAAAGDARTYRDAQHLYRVVALLGEDGILLRQLKHTIGSVTFQDAQKVLRRSGAVVETKEYRRSQSGRRMNLVVLRTAEHGVRDESLSQPSAATQYQPSQTRPPQ